MSNEGKRMHLETFEGESACVDHSTPVNTGENNLISNIFSIDFDPWGESLSSTQNLAKLFRHLIFNHCMVALSKFLRT